MKAKLYRFFIELTNGPLTSSVLKKFTQSGASRPFIKTYAAVYKINKDEMVRSIHLYPNLHSFFIRKLKEHARTVDMNPETVISPVDGIIEDTGTVTADREIVVKGKTYSITEMLGSRKQAEKYEGGQYIILYLSPSHYHRIHSPVTGKVINTYSSGGRSFPVNRWGLKYGKSVLAKNYRVISEIKTDESVMAMVKVGAMFINSVVVTNKNDEWKKGEEAAYFSFGSTVVLLFQEGAFLLKDGLHSHMEVKMGIPIGTMLHTGEKNEST